MSEEGSGHVSDATSERAATSSLVYAREGEAAEALNTILDTSGSSANNSENDDTGATFSQPRNELSAHSTILIKR